MGKLSFTDNTSFTHHDDVIEQIDKEAEEAGLSRAKYIRQRFQAGRILFQCSNKLNLDLLNELVETDTPVTVDSELHSLGDTDITETILTEMPADESRAISKEELRQVIFGTEEEQIETITEALRELDREGKIKTTIDGDYIKQE